MLSQNDCIKILNYYRVPLPHSKQAIQNKAEMLISTKLCKCSTKGKRNVKCKGKKNITCKRKAKKMIF